MNKQETMKIREEKIHQNVIESWSINLNSIAWREELKDYCTKNRDI